MPITPDDCHLVTPGQSRISRERFRQVLIQQAAKGVVDERDPGEYYDAIEATQAPDGRCVDPLFVLAMFNHESTMGKAGVARTTRSWGNTRAPNFGATPIGEEPGMSGSFPIWRDWLDGARSTAARLVAPNHVYAGRNTIRSIFDWPPNQNLVWAPAGDFNQPTSYLRAMIDFMSAYADREVGSEPVHLLISAGHWDTTGDLWNGEELKRTRPLAIAIADEAERRGFRVTRQVDKFDGTYRDVANWAARQAVEQRIRLLFQVHFEGTHPSVRGAFAIPPHQPSRNDYDRDAERIGLDIVRRLNVATGMPIRGNGVMLETATAAGELAFFSRSAHVKASTERLLLEYGASNSNLEDRAIVDSPGFYERAARVTVDAFEAFYGKQERRVERLDLPWNISDSPTAWHCSATDTWVTNRKFIEFYQKFGENALDLFGLPIQGEASLDEASGTTTQYFERARFEWHPRNAGTRYEVQLGRLGAEAIAQRTRAVSRAMPEIRVDGAAAGQGQRLEIVTDGFGDQRAVELHVRRIVIILDDDERGVTFHDTGDERDVIVQPTGNERSITVHDNGNDRYELSLERP